jgi:hypothetical protein
MNTGLQAATQLCAAHRDVVEIRWGPRHDITLVRPDGYSAFTAGIHDGLRALESVPSILEARPGRADGRADLAHSAPASVSAPRS